jgi:hypothetical protein
VDQTRRHRQTELNLGKSGVVAKFFIQISKSNPRGLSLPDSPHSGYVTFLFVLNSVFDFLGGGNELNFGRLYYSGGGIFSWG